MKKNLLLMVLGLSAIITEPSFSQTRDYIKIVGSSTVYPFALLVAEAYKKKTGSKTPKIEAIGSGGGITIFCGNKGINSPDIANMSRRITEREFKYCQKNGIKDIIEVQIGFDGIALAHAKTSTPFKLSSRDIFLALAKQVPEKEGSKKLIDNPYETWKAINSTLPDTPIKVFGPALGSGTRDTFAKLAMEKGCRTFNFIKAFEKTYRTKYKVVCRSIREDGLYIEAEEDYRLIVDKLAKDTKALGIVSFSFITKNSDKVQGAIIDEQPLSFESITNGSYPISRPLYFYVKKLQIDNVIGIKTYLKEFTSESAWGHKGYLTKKGLIPLPKIQRKEIAANVKALTPMSL